MHTWAEGLGAADRDAAQRPACSVVHNLQIRPLLHRIKGAI